VLDLKEKYCYPSIVITHYELVQVQKRNNDGDDVVDFLSNQMIDYAASPEVEDELSLYLDQKIGATDVLSYWCINRHKLPKMSHLARKLLAIPATSTASERVFSTCGVILTDRR
jgi:hypothetical protein